MRNNFETNINNESDAGTIISYGNSKTKETSVKSISIEEFSINTETQRNSLYSYDPVHQKKCSCNVM